MASSSPCTSPNQALTQKEYLHPHSPTFSERSLYGREPQSSASPHPQIPPPPPPSPQPSSTSAATHHADYRPGEEVYERRLLVLRAAAGSPVAAAARSPAARLARGGAARRVRTAAVRAGVRRRRGGNPAHYRRQVRRPLHRRAQPPHPRPRRRLPRARHRDHSVSAWPVERVRMNCLQWRERERQSAIHSSSVRRR